MYRKNVTALNLLQYYSERRGSQCIIDLEKDNNRPLGTLDQSLSGF